MREADAADLFMREYGMTLRQFYHDYTPYQIETLTERIRVRKLEDFERAVVAANPKDPEKLMESIAEQLRPYRPQRMKNIADLTDEDLAGLNVSRAH